MYNQDEDRFFCLTEAPNKDVVQKHHSKHGFNCEWITEVKDYCLDYKTSNYVETAVDSTI